MKVLIVSPYHGGSHAAWAEGYRAHSQHEVDLLTLPARFWKWRMHGGAVTLARRFMEGDAPLPDVILATDMLDLTTFLSLTRRRTSGIAVGVYMHENQLTDPLPEDGETGPMRRQLGERDHHYAFINFASLLTADFILFNSHYHHDSWFAALPNFLKHFPEYNELNTIETLRDKSSVLSVGVDFGRLAIRDSTTNLQSPISNSPPLILWNQRWEYDKNPDDFFRALRVMQKEGVLFRLALCGQQYGQRPSTFTSAIEQFADQIIHVGYADEEAYRRLLWQSAVTISTAHHEFFGISILEAIYCHTFPILPHRLSYPELIPEPYHLQCLYQNQGGLVARLRWALTHGDEAQQIAAELAQSTARFDWSEIVKGYDDFLESTAL
jgi:glycosyltransferase involved in cell wall biosynthesis